MRMVMVLAMITVAAAVAVVDGEVKATEEYFALGLI